MVLSIWFQSAWTNILRLVYLYTYKYIMVSIKLSSDYYSLSLIYYTIIYLIIINIELLSAYYTFMCFFLRY